MDLLGKLEEHLVIPAAVEAVDREAAPLSRSMGIARFTATLLLSNPGGARCDQVLSMLSQLGFTLTLVPAGLEAEVRSDRPAHGDGSAATTRGWLSSTLSVLFERLRQERGRLPVSGTMHGRFPGSSRQGFPGRYDPSVPVSLATLSQAAAAVRLRLCAVTMSSPFAGCAKLDSPGKEPRRRASDALYDALVFLTDGGDAQFFLSKPDLFVADLLDRVAFAGAELEIAMPDGGVVRVATASELADVVGQLSATGRLDVEAERAGVPAHQANLLATKPGAFRTSTFAAFLEACGASMSAAAIEAAPSVVVRP
jgi:hypothetical protein